MMPARCFARRGTACAQFCNLSHKRVRETTPLLGLLCFALVADLAYSQAPAVVVTGLKTPLFVAVDKGGNLYIADQACIGGFGDCNVYKETLSAGTYAQSTVDTFTAATPPMGVAVDANGDVYIGVFGVGLYRETQSGKSYIRTLVGCADSAIQGVALDGNGGIYIASSGRVYKETLSSTCYNTMPVAGGAAGASQFDLNVAADSCGDVYVHQKAIPGFVLKETPSGNGYTQSEVMGSSSISALAADIKGDVYVAADNGSLYMALPSTTSYAQTELQSGLTSPGGVAVDSAGNVYVVEESQNRIWKVSRQARSQRV